MKSLLFLLFPLTAMANPLECYDLAVMYPRNLTSFEAISLCKGDVNRAAIYCFDVTANRNLTAEQRIRLCRGAADATPIYCFDNSRTRINLTTDERIQLCGKN